MKDLIAEVTASVFMEYERASKKFGRTHNGPHEAYAVMLEEFEEARDCLKEDVGLGMILFWNATKENKPTCDAAKKIQEAAIKAAAEMIQVAAMAYKWVYTFEKVEKLEDTV